MTKRKWDVVDFLLIAALVGIVLVVIWFATGCTRTQELSDSKIVWSDGKGCIMYAENMTVVQAKEMQKNFKFSDCEVIFNDEINEGVKKE
jgi:hypothetical protein